MAETKTYYELELAGDENIISFLKPYALKQYDFRRDANAARRAVATLFGDAVRAEIISVRRVPARTVRRKLRVK